MNGPISKEIERRNKLLRQKKFEGANKPGRFLAWQIKQRKEKNSIQKIKVKGKEVLDQKGIKKVFNDFYTKLFEAKEVDSLKIKS